MTIGDPLVARMYEHDYTLLEKAEPKPEPQSSPTSQKLIKSLFYVGIVLLPVLGFLVGQYGPYDLAGPRTCNGHELASDTFFGGIPRQLVPIEPPDQRFIDAEPTTFYPNGTRVPSLWDTIYPGPYVAIQNPGAVGLQGKGANMAERAADPSRWPPGTEGFVVQGLHQLHCLMSIKQALMFDDPDRSQRSSPGKPKEPNLKHIGHCVEILRQAVMCHADLSLTRPLFHEPTDRGAGDGKLVEDGHHGQHVCRDWSKVYKAAMRMRVSYSVEVGWADTSQEL